MTGLRCCDAELDRHYNAQPKNQALWCVPGALHLSVCNWPGLAAGVKPGGRSDHRAYWSLVYPQLPATATTTPPSLNILFIHIAQYDQLDTGHLKMIICPAPPCL